MKGKIIGVIQAVLVLFILIVFVFEFLFISPALAFSSIDSCASQPSCGSAIISETGIKNSIRNFAPGAANKIVNLTVRDTVTKTVISTSQTSVPSVSNILFGAAGASAIALFLTADGAENLRQQVQDPDSPFDGGQLPVPYDFDVRFRPNPDAEWEYLTLDGFNDPGPISDIYLHLDSDINVAHDREGFPAVEGLGRGGDFTLYVFFDSVGEYRHQKFGRTGIYTVGTAEFLGLHPKDDEQTEDPFDTLTDTQILDQMSQAPLPVPALEPGQEVVISAGAAGFSTDGNRVSPDPLVITEPLPDDSLGSNSPGGSPGGSPSGNDSPGDSPPGDDSPGDSPPDSDSPGDSPSGNNSPGGSPSGDSSDGDFWLDTNGDGVPDTEVPGDLVPVDTDGDGVPDRWTEPVEVPVAPEVGELEPDTFDAQPWLPYAIAVFGNKFPFDIFGDMEATSLPTECPVYTFLGYSHELCPIRDLIGVLKYPAIVGYMIAAYHRL